MNHLPSVKIQVDSIREYVTSYIQDSSKEIENQIDNQLKSIDIADVISKQIHEVFPKLLKQRVENQLDWAVQSIFNGEFRHELESQLKPLIIKSLEKVIDNMKKR